MNFKHKIHSHLVRPGYLGLGYVRHGYGAWLLIAGLTISFATMLRASTVQAQSSAPQSMLAETPPMGWNSWDSYGTTIKEDQVKANAEWMAKHLKPFGWQYVVVDMEWFVSNPVAEGNSKNSQYTLDRFGRYIPAPNRFPSSAAGAGFRPLADSVHALGLKFGIHILQGIPKEAVKRNDPIEGSVFHVSDAADTSGTCGWNPDNYDVKNNAAGQAYYDSIARLYAGWGVDFIKVDCIASRPYKGNEIRMLSTALQKTGRPIVLSLSPGPAPMDKLDELRKYSQMWRISNDTWDVWHSTQAYPQGVVDQFPRAAKWALVSEPGHWPDADMLPLGYLGPAPGWGKPRETRLSLDEQKTLLSLWIMMRSPLMMGGNLPRSQEWTTSLLTNPEVLAVDQHSSGNHAALTTDNVVVWTAKSEIGLGTYVAVFNTGETSQKVQYSWSTLGLGQRTYRVRDLWQRRDVPDAAALSVTLPTHACVLYRLTPR